MPLEKFTVAAFVAGQLADDDRPAPQRGPSVVPAQAQSPVGDLRVSPTPTCVLITK
jgi:hypothetical protein